MLKENKNLSLKDTNKLTEGFSQEADVLSYTKTNKLMTALYMVTDIMDKNEPLRNRLRILGIDILSDTYVHPAEIDGKVSEIISLLSISSSMGMISEMNENVLKREFMELKKASIEYNQKKSIKDPGWLEELMKEEAGDRFEGKMKDRKPIGRIGVQKGSTLLKALNKIGMSNKNDDIRHKRQDEILKIIKDKGGINIGIKDVHLAFREKNEEVGEKTLQRELVTMVQNGILRKEGEKRWSRYSIRF
jgi:hypothetical protein